jgi:ATP-dependent DNA helicase UvrD/PcrA
VTVPVEIVAAMGSEPTEEQWRAISLPLEPYVVVAGAGSGKTSVMAARIVYLALVGLGRLEADHPGVLPGNVLCLTFTNKATENLTLRVRRALRSLDLPEGEEPEILNYHGFAAQVLDRHGLRAGIEPGQRVLTPAQRSELCRMVLEQMSFRHAKAEWQPTLVGNIIDLADQCANHRVPLDEVIRFNTEQLPRLAEEKNVEPYHAALQRIELAEAAKVFESLKRERGVIDFGDQITLALDVVERNDDVGAEYRERFSAVLLDEYQDTNVAQALLIAEVFGDGFPVTAVGDPDQNIYAWRGASLFNLLNFPRQFPNADGTPSPKLPLYTNFRSGARILAAADTIIRPVPEDQRPDPDKELRPWPANGEGEVAVVRCSDEWAEAAWIADRIVERHESGDPWSSVAVLCRASRLFPALQEAFAERGIPAEFVGLSGLLRLPEVVEILAYARAVADSTASVALARILLGPRYRVGFKDLARVASWAKEKNYRLRESEEGEVTPFLFAEALEHLNEVTGLSDEARDRLEEFRAELAALRAEARRPVGEFLAEVVRRTGLLAELDAHPDVEMSTARRRNIAAFLDEVHAFTPVEGELTLRAFLDYVEVVQDAERQEWSPVQPTDADSVKVMTIHQAKGLEFDTVFVPGMAKDVLPNNRLQHNPAEKGKSLDFELRGDRDVLPTFAGNLREFWRRLKDQELIEERRTCYVALTRSRRRLFCSGAHWYGEGERVKKPSEFFEELADWGESTGMAAVDRGPEPGDEHPEKGHRERLVSDWPGPAQGGDADELFPEGWRRAALATVAAGGSGGERLAEEGADGEVKPIEARTPGGGSSPGSPSGERPADGNGAEDGGAGGGAVRERLAAADRAAYEAEAAQNRQLAAHLLEVERTQQDSPWMPATIAVGGVVDYARCPKRFYWSYVRPLPRFSSPAARIGTEIHRWIERRSSGQTTLIDLDEPPDLTPEELAGEPGRIERLRQAYLDSRFAGRVPLFAERPFLLQVDDFVLSGRIDAIYGEPEGAWEVVDYKTGRRPDPDDPLTRLQLDVYALACTTVWSKRPENLRLVYLYLRTGEEDTWPAEDPQATRARVSSALAGMAAGSFDPVPGEQCRWCDFRPFCAPGREFVERTTASE